eukprot:TRINITY_DN720_c0_g1_i3.p1 TRINITY_DN720_c0_g1~~TRINITY_DN720_c0_g1_i3.p1  ORF type:complete len:124 (+),score=4.47 TRINITY_DN720_c0_g1_i3:211-582(+)
MALFIGRVSRDVRPKDLEDLFSQYGNLKRCDLKTNFAFVTFEDERDAEDAVKAINGTELFGSRVNVEWAKGSSRYDENARRRGGGGSRRSPDRRHRVLSRFIICHPSVMHSSIPAPLASCTCH